MAATHRGLRAEVEAGRFRPDLMYRLRVVPLFIPPLRARPGDVLLLADKMIETLNLRGGRRGRTAGAGGERSALAAYAWPGNVRELRNVLEYAYVVGDGPVVVETDLPPEVFDSHAEEVTGLAVNRPLPLPATPTSSPEADRIRRAIERAAGNRDRAAQILGLSRSTLWRRMKVLGL